MTAPAIVGVQIVERLPRAGHEGDLATLTIEHGPWIIRGFTLALDERGKPYLRPPRMQSREHRVALRNGPERTALLGEALKLVTGFLEIRTAAQPLATAPETVEPSLDPS